MASLTLRIETLRGDELDDGGKRQIDLSTPSTVMAGLVPATHAVVAGAAWADHPEHLPVKELGREKFYIEDHLQVCEVVRESKFARQIEPSGREA